MKETEITVELLEDINLAKEKILSKGFKESEKIKMIDFYYSKFSLAEISKMEYGELLKNSFVVRKVLCEDKCEEKIIYKDKVLDENNNVISEEKVECKIEKTQSILKILNCANLTCWCELEQDMTVYSNEFTSFILQEVKDLVNFIEYEEDEDLKKFNEYEKINILLNRLKDIGLKFGEDYSCKKVYLKFKKSLI